MSGAPFPSSPFFLSSSAFTKETLKSSVEMEEISNPYLSPSPTSTCLYLSSFYQFFLEFPPQNLTTQKLPHSIPLHRPHSLHLLHVNSSSKLDWLCIYSPPSSHPDNLISYKFLSSSPTWKSGYRANALLTFAVIILALMRSMASISDNLNHPTPISEVQVLSINWFQKQPNGNDENMEIRLVLKNTFTDFFNGKKSLKNTPLQL